MLNKEEHESFRAKSGCPGLQRRRPRAWPRPWLKQNLACLLTAVLVYTAAHDTESSEYYIWMDYKSIGQKMIINRLTEQYHSNIEHHKGAET